MEGPKLRILKDAELRPLPLCMSTGKRLRASALRASALRASALAALWRGCYTARIRQVAVNVDKENA